MICVVNEAQMMSEKVKTSFGWKRKAGDNIHKEKVAFSVDDNEIEENDELVDWMSLLPKKPALSIEDPATKSARLKDEGIVLAEEDRFWEAILKWDEAIQLNPRDEKLFEMKAQALMSVGEVEPAVETAKVAVSLVPKWWVGHQTLGRALACVGEIKLALKSFSRAVHLNPSDKELWEEDLLWAKSLAVRLVDKERGLQIQECQNTALTKLVPSDLDINNPD